MRLIECVPNFSEGRRPDVIAAIRAAMEAVPGLWVLDLHADAVHNRSVITCAGAPEPVLEAAFRGVARAAELIDLRHHQGEHPRIGATDVVPFIPLDDASMSDCVRLAQRLGARVGDELGIPVYLYAEAARQLERRWLPTVRSGEYERLGQAIQVDPSRAPDFGPSRLGPAGATAVGARPFLVAYNVNLATPDLQVARDIARLVRSSSGGLPAVQARGMRTAQQEVVQVSMNLLDIGVTPVHTAFAEVERQAAAHGVPVLGAELVGLSPLRAVTAAARLPLGLSELDANQVVEARLLRAILTSEADAGV